MLRSAFVLAVAVSLPASMYAQTRPLNDTGITFCGEFPSGTAAAPCALIEQDADHGRDAAAQAGALPKIGGSADAANGFDFTKIAHDGSVLPSGAALASGARGWGCSRDNVTGLMWEVKVDDVLQMRHQGHTYTWHDPASPDGNPGATGDAMTCGNTLGSASCNTAEYVAAVNAEQLCGHADWRLPTVKELEGIADLNRANPAIDPDYFPNTPSSVFWTGSPFTGDSNDAWYVVFEDGVAYHLNRDDAHHVRLVRGGQSLAAISGPLTTYSLHPQTLRR